MFEHNRVTLKQVENYIARGSDCCVVNPCGSGKTEIMTSLIRNHQDNSFTLVTKQGNARGYYLGRDQIFNDVNIITYTKLLKDFRDGSIDSYNTDFLLLDEAHYIGADKWRTAIGCVKHRFNPLMIGFTATPKRYEQQELDTSIVDEYFCGNMAGGYTSKDLQDRNLFIEPQVFVSLYRLDEEVEKRESKIEQLDISDKERGRLKSQLNFIKRNWEQNYSPKQVVKDNLPNYLKRVNNKILVYSSSIKRLELDKELLDSILISMYGKGAVKSYIYTYKSNQSVLDNFIKDDGTYLKVLYSVDRIMETVHIDNLNALVMFRPSVSNRIIVQQYGRINSINRKDKALILDFVGNIDKLKDLEKTFARDNRNHKISNRVSINFKYVYGNHDLFHSIDMVLSRSGWYTYNGITGNLNLFARIYGCNIDELANCVKNGLDLGDALEICKCKEISINTESITGIHSFKDSDKPVTSEMMDKVTRLVQNFVKTRNIEDEDLIQDLYVYAYEHFGNTKLNYSASLVYAYERLLRAKISYSRVVKNFADVSVNEPGLIVDNDMLSNVYYENVVKAIDEALLKATRSSSRLYNMIVERFGLNGKDCKTLKEVGKMFNITASSVGRYEANIIRKLRSPYNLRTLGDLLDDMTV